jgi:hypothetical protein
MYTALTCTQHSHVHSNARSCLITSPLPPPSQELCLRCLYMDESCLPALARCQQLTSLALSFDNISWDATPPFYVEAAVELLQPLRALTNLRSLELHCHTWSELADKVRGRGARCLLQWLL